MTSEEVVPKYYTAREVASIMSVTELTVRTWCNNPDPKKRLNGHKVGKQWRITPLALQDFANRTYS